MVALKTEATGGDASAVVVSRSIFFHRDRISRNKPDFNVGRNSDRNCRYPAAAAVAAATMLLRRNVTRVSLWDETRTSRRKLIPHDETVTTSIDNRTVVILGYTSDLHTRCPGIIWTLLSNMTNPFHGSI